MGQLTRRINMNNIPVLLYFSAFLCVGSPQPQEQIPAIPGAAGRDYPAYTSPPKTSFTCEGLSPGYYSDPEGECQVYHHCTHAVAKPSFTRLCPVGTLYNQQYFICDWWFNVDCSTVEDFYSLNDDVAAAQIEAGK